MVFYPHNGAFVNPWVWEVPSLTFELGQWLRAASRWCRDQSKNWPPWETQHKHEHGVTWAFRILTFFRIIYCLLVKTLGLWDLQLSEVVSLETWIKGTKHERLRHAATTSLGQRKHLRQYLFQRVQVSVDAREISLIMWRKKQLPLATREGFKSGPKKTTAEQAPWRRSSTQTWFRLWVTELCIQADWVEIEALETTGKKHPSVS